MNSFDNFGERLKYAIKIKNITQKSLAEEINISKTAMNNYAQGRVPEPDILLKISQYLNVSMEWLLTGSGIGPKTKEEVSKDQKFLSNFLKNLQQGKFEPILNYPLDTIGERIAYARENSGLSITYLAEKTGYSKIDISSYEFNKEDPPTDFLIKLSDITNILLDWIYLGSKRNLLITKNNITNEDSYLNLTNYFLHNFKSQFWQRINTILETFYKNKTEVLTEKLNIPIDQFLELRKNNQLPSENILVNAYKLFSLLFDKLLDDSILPNSTTDYIFEEHQLLKLYKILPESDKREINLLLSLKFERIDDLKNKDTSSILRQDEEAATKSQLKIG